MVPEGLFCGVLMLMCVLLKTAVDPIALGILNSLIVNERRHVIQTKSFLMCKSGNVFIENYKTH